MMDMSLISVIIPMYNASRFIKKCIISILDQTYENFELLIINDGSTDNSLEICNEFNDKRIKIINQENAGCEYARLTGIKQSKGEYICFVDADDWIAKDYLETLIAPSQKYNVDVTCIKSYKVIDKYGIIKLKNGWDNFQEKLLTPDELKKHNNFLIYNRVFSNTIWGKLYRTSIIDKNNITPSNIFYGEDTVFNLHLSPNIKSCYLINQYKYYYRYGGNTLTNHDRYWQDSVKLYSEIKKMALKYDNKDLLNFYFYQIVSIFHGTISYKYKFLQQPDTELIKFINAVLSSDIYNDLIFDNKFQSEFKFAIKQKDAKMILEMIKQDNKSNIPLYKNQILRILVKFLN